VAGAAAPTPRYFWELIEASDDAIDTMGVTNLIDYPDLTPGVTGSMDACDGRLASDSNDGFYCNNAITSGGDHTIMVRMKWTHASNFTVGGRWSSSTYGWRMYVEAGKVKCEFYDNVGHSSYYVNDTTTTNDGSWHWYACTIAKGDPGTFTLWRDGAVRNTKDIYGTEPTGAIITCLLAHRVGSVSHGGQPPSGQDTYIDNALYWTTALTTTQLNDIWASGENCCVATPTITPTPTVTPTPSPVATNSCCHCGEDENCEDPETYGVGWECPPDCTPIPQAACVEVPE
jgi:hypothetical protein